MLDGGILCRRKLYGLTFKERLDIPVYTAGRGAIPEVVADRRSAANHWRLFLGDYYERRPIETAVAHG